MSISLRCNVVWLGESNGCEELGRTYGRVYVRVCTCHRCSTDQGSVSTSTAQSEIKAVNHTLKKEVIANRGILNRMGWKQEPTVIEEDNSACVFASKALHFTKNLRHLDLSECWLKEKVADKTCVLRKVESKHNNSDIGTKRVPQYVFNALTNQLVERSQRTNL